MTFALGNIALVAAALGLFFLGDPATLFWFLDPAHSRYGFFAVLVILFASAEWLNKTICIDTGCVFGGALTALRYPQYELVSVPAAKMYYEPVKPLEGALTEAAERPYNDILDIGDVQGKRIITTRIRGTEEAHGPPRSVVLDRQAVCVPDRPEPRLVPAGHALLPLEAL